MRRITTSILATFLYAALAFAARQPLTHETMWLMKRVGAPSVSPDGRLVVFAVTNPSYDEKEQTSDLWIVPADGSAAPRQITFTKGGESEVDWSPDSQRIAFSTKRENDEQNQIYVLDVAHGGEAQRVTTLAMGARNPRWSPSGNAILVTSAVFPGAPDEEANQKVMKERKDRKYKVRTYDTFPIRNWDRWIEETQTHLIVQPLGEGAKPKDLLAGSKIASGPGYSGRGGDGGDAVDAVWSPDGSSIVFAVTTERNVSAYSEVSFDLYRVAAGGGEPERIAHGAGSYSRPQFSPDGRTLYAVFNANNGKVYNLDRLVAFDWPSMKNRRLVAPASEHSISNYAISPDGKTIWFNAEDAGIDQIYSLPAAGGTERLAVPAERGVYGDLAIAAKAQPPVMIARWGSSVNPQELVRIDPASRSRRNLTSFNVAKAAEIDWQPPIHFWFTSSRGKKIHNLIVLPPNFDENKKYPLFVLIHGGPAGQWKDTISLRWNYHLLAAPGYVLLMTNYTGSTGFGERFAQEIQGDPFKGPADEINEAADEAIRRFKYIDASRQVAGGASYGGHLANWLEATTTRYKALVSHAGLINSEAQWGTSDTIYSRELMNLGPVWEQGEVWRKQNPIRYAANFKTPMLLSVGERDFRVPMNNTLEAWAALQRQKVPSRLLVWPDENHWILNGENSRQFYKEVADWFAKWL